MRLDGCWVGVCWNLPPPTLRWWRWRCYGSKRSTPDGFGKVCVGCVLVACGVGGGGWGQPQGATQDPTNVSVCGELKIADTARGFLHADCDLQVVGFSPGVARERNGSRLPPPQVPLGVTGAWHCTYNRAQSGHFEHGRPAGSRRRTHRPGSSCEWAKSTRQLGKGRG